MTYKTATPLSIPLRGGPRILKSFTDTLLTLVKNVKENSKKPMKNTKWG